MTATATSLHLEVTPAAREAIAAALGRHPSPVIVRLRILPGSPPMAQMYLAKPRPGEEVLEYGPARLVVDPDSRTYLEGATVDFHPGTPQGGFSVEGLGLRTPRPGAGSDPGRPAGEEDGREGPLREALRKVYDPEIPVNIVDLGLIYGVEWPAEGQVRIRMTMTSPGCPVAGLLHDEVKAVAERVPGVRSAEVEIVWDPPWSPERMSPEAKRQFGYS